ncbi:MAG TPA: VOC family protein [Pirellulaceae bacterium]|nr:VOC family protein [Pirellulaceae bacterium]
MRPQPLIAVTDVEASSRWYQRLLGCQSAHGGKEYERLIWRGQLVMQLHSFEVHHHHGPIGDVNDEPYGNGVLLWFEIDDFDAAMDRVAELNPRIVLPRHRNPPDGRGGPNHWECWLRDPDGYTVVLASPDGSAAGESNPPLRYSLLRLVLLLTVSCVALAVVRNGMAAAIFAGGPLVLMLWELIQFGREMSRAPSQQTQPRIVARKI